MNETSLELRNADETGGIATAYKVGQTVKLFSDYYDTELPVKITHNHDGEIGGTLVGNITDPMLGYGDHIHFQPKHVMDVVSN